MKPSDTTLPAPAKAGRSQFFTGRSFSSCPATIGPFTAIPVASIPNGPSTRSRKSASYPFPARSTNACPKSPTPKFEYSYVAPISRGKL